MNDYPLKWIIGSIIEAFQLEGNEYEERKEGLERERGFLEVSEEKLWS